MITTLPPFDPTPDQWRQLTDRARLGSLERLTLVKRHNDLWRLQSSAGTFYLKAFTKSWYSEDVSATPACVTHEVIAHTLLRQHGLAGPTIRWAATDSEVLGRPALLLGELPGQPLTTLLTCFPAEANPLLRAVGAYLARMHTVTFPFSGYLMTLEGPEQAPNPAAWQHPIWTLDAWHRRALDTLAAPDLPPGLKAALQQQLIRFLPELEAVYVRPRFTHGDCHASQFYLERRQGDWQVTGVLDLEVASAGACASDFVQLALELRGAAIALDWWTPPFEGYGQAPELEHLRLLLLFAGQDSWQAHGPVDWPTELESVRTATGWQELFSRRTAASVTAALTVQARDADVLRRNQTRPADSGKPGSPPCALSREARPRYPTAPPGMLCDARLG